MHMSKSPALVGLLSGIAFGCWILLIAFDASTGKFSWLVIHSAGAFFAAYVCHSCHKTRMKMEALYGTVGQAVAPLHGHSDPPAAGRTDADSDHAGTGSAGTSASQGTGERASIVLGEVEAYRAWKIAGDFLVSFNGAVWLPDRPMDGKGIELDNGTGIYAFKKLKAAKDYIDYQSGQQNSIAIGRVLMWGTIVEHELGYRAEYARLIELVEVGESVSTFAAIVRRYNLEDHKQ